MRRSISEGGTFWVSPFNLFYNGQKKLLEAWEKHYKDLGIRTTRKVHYPNPNRKQDNVLELLVHLADDQDSWERDYEWVI